MEYGKYIILTGAGCFEQAILFDSTLSHDDFLKAFNEDCIVSAGMFMVGAKPREGDKDDIDVSVFGESVTLDLKVRKGQDERLIKRILRKEWF